MQQKLALIHGGEKEAEANVKRNKRKKYYTDASFVFFAVFDLQSFVIYTTTECLV